MEDGKNHPTAKSEKKPADQAKSYRPVSLLSPTVKALEAYLPDLQKHLTLADHQHAFRKDRSTTAALMEIDNRIIAGLNKDKLPHRTVLVALDMRAPFDTVNISIIFETICQSTLPPMKKRWLGSYLKGRQTYTEFRNVSST